jgi:hypothetical protein
VNELATITYDSFIQLLETEDMSVIRKTFAHAELHETTTPMPVYFWLADRKVGVFVFQTYSLDETEFGFMTSDRKLIESLYQVFESYKAGRSRASAEDVPTNSNEALDMSKDSGV